MGSCAKVGTLMLKWSDVIRPRPRLHRVNLPPVLPGTHDTIDTVP